MLTIIIYLLNIELSLMWIPYLNIVKGKPWQNHKDDLKTVEVVTETNFLYMDMTISKRDITLEPLGRTSQIICHAHLLFMCIVYINFHVDDLKTVVTKLDKKRQRKDDLSPVFAMWPFNRYSAYQGRSLRTYLGFVPTQIRRRQMAHLDDFICDIWIFLARMYQHRCLGRTLTPWWYM